MRHWRWLLVCGTLCLLGLWPADRALAVSVSGQSSTEIEWFDDAQEDTSVPAYEYLRLNLRDIDGGGLHFRGYGRLADDLANETDVESRLYYAYLEKKDLLPHLDFKFGRQFIATTAGASIMDGLTLQYRDLGPFSLTAFGGGDVAYYKGYSAKDMIDGVKLSGHFLGSLDASLSYLQKWEESELTHELFGLDVDYDFHDRLGLYGEAQYNYLTKGLSYFNGGVNLHWQPAWSLRLDYLYSLPVFSSTSIYSVFAVSEYQEASAEFNYRLDDGLRTFGRYAQEMYEEVDDANVFEAGVEKIRTDRFSGYLIFVLRHDPDGQDLRGAKARAAYRFNKYLQAGIGAHVDVLERRIAEADDETTSSRVWADATAYFSRKVNVEAKIERGESDLWDHFYRGRVRLNILF